MNQILFYSLFLRPRKARKNLSSCVFHKRVCRCVIIPDLPSHAGYASLCNIMPVACSIRYISRLNKTKAAQSQLANYSYHYWI